MVVRSFKSFCFLLLFCVSTTIVNAQDVLVHSGFLRDSLSIGDETGYYLTATYPSDLNILFPDSTYQFSPFEFYRKVYFTTETHSGKSYDSAIYYLSTFEVEKLQSLSLPVFQLNEMDTTIYNSPRDTIMLSEYVKNLPDTLSAQNLPLKVNTAYQNVSFLFNYPILFIIVGVLLVVAVAGWLIFGQRIRKHYRLKRMQKIHQKFLETYTGEVETIKKAFSTARTENALVEWKRYMEHLESRPYTKLTSRETTRLEKDETLGKYLSAVDGAIYGHNKSVIESLEQLKAFAQQRFSKRLEEVRHG